MLCLDWKENQIELFGPEAGGTYAEIDIAVVPCNLRLIPLGADDDRIGDECIADLD